MLRRVALVRADFFDGTYRPHHQVDNNSDIVFLRSVLWLLGKWFLVTLNMEVISSSETSVLARATRHNIPEDGILHSHRRENLKSYMALTGWTL
jgi:hypothetical protein